MRIGILLDRAGTVIASATQDVEPILKRNQRLRADPQTSDWGRHVATIPNVILPQRGARAGKCRAAHVHSRIRRARRAQARRPGMEISANR
jgi:hypothetical protein